MRKVLASALAVVAIGALAFMSFLVFWPDEVPTAEALVTQACADMQAVGSFDMQITMTLANTSLGLLQAKTFLEYSGDLVHSFDREYKDGVEVGEAVEVVVDYANDRRYWRLGNAPWKTSALPDREPEFPYSKEAICPDLTDAAVTLVGDDTVNGTAARKYSYASRKQAFDWFFWIDSNGWLIQVESTKLDAGATGAAGQSGPGTSPGFDSTATISGRGEANSITIPQVGQ